MIVGSGGAGKSTLARHLGEILGIEVFHLDKLFWKPNWVETDLDAFVDIQRSVMQKSSWIIDGNYSATLDVRLKEADTVLYLDYAVHVCLFRALKRFALNRGRSRADMAEGCIEKIDKEFIAWIWNFRRRSRPKLLEKLQSVNGSKNIVIIKSPAMAKRLLEQIRISSNKSAETETE